LALLEITSLRNIRDAVKTGLSTANKACVRTNARIIVCRSIEITTVEIPAATTTITSAATTIKLLQLQQQQMTSGSAVVLPVRHHDPIPGL